MKIELLVVPGCPHAVTVKAALEQAASQAGDGDVPVTVTVIRSDQQARARGFVGSPTVLINGADPFSTPGAPAGLACRMYFTRHGLSAVPELDQLRDALLRAGNGQATAEVDR